MSESDPLDTLAVLLPAAEKLGIEVPWDMPLDTPEHQRAAVCYVSRLIMKHRRESRGG